MPHPVFQCMLERTDATTNEILGPVTFVLAYPTVYMCVCVCVCVCVWICGGTQTQDQRRHTEPRAQNKVFRRMESDDTVKTFLEERRVKPRWKFA